MGTLVTGPLIRPSGTFSHEGRGDVQWPERHHASLLHLWEKVAPAQRETDEGFCP